MRKVRTYCGDTDLVKERRSHIVLTATSLIVQKGYNNVSTRDLAAALGMSTGGLYHYIGTKEDIIYLIVNYTSDLTGQMLEQFNADLSDYRADKQLKESIRIFLDGTEKYRDFYNLLNHIMLSLDLEDRRIVYENETRIVEYFECLLKKGVAEGLFRPHDSKCVAHNIVAITHAWANRGWYLKRYYTIDKYIEEQTDAIFSLLIAGAVYSSNLR